MTIRLPDDLYEELRKEAFEKRTHISKLILSRCAGEFDAIHLEQSYNVPPPKSITTVKAKVQSVETVSIPEPIKPIPAKAIPLISQKIAEDTCKHGYAKGFCKFGCK